MAKALSDISNRDRKLREANVFRRLSTSPSKKNHVLTGNADMRAGTNKSGYQTSPRRLSVPEEVRNITSSVDRHQFIGKKKNGSLEVNNGHVSTEIVFPVSPLKVWSDNLSSGPSVGGDGSLSRIKNRLSPAKDVKPIITVNEVEISPTRQNLLSRLQKDEDLSKVTKKNTRMNSEGVSGFKVGKSQMVTRSKNVKFELPEDRMIAIELQNTKQLLQTLLERQDQLEQRIAELERNAR